MLEFTISLEPFDEASRQHWCDVQGCREQMLFLDEAASKQEGGDIWVCWPHGQLKLREDFQWWDHRPQRLHAVVNTPEDPGIVVGSKVRFVPQNLTEVDPTLEGAIGRTGVVTEIVDDDLLRVKMDEDPQPDHYSPNGLFPKTDYIRRETPALY